jgi:hypothetical protein
MSPTPSNRGKGDFFFRVVRVIGLGSARRHGRRHADPLSIQFFFRRVVTRFEKLIELYDGFFRLACAFIALNRLVK